MAIGRADRDRCLGPPGRSACNTDGRLEITPPWETMAARGRGQSCGSDFSEMLRASEETQVALRRSRQWQPRAGRRGAPEPWSGLGISWAVGSQETGLRPAAQTRTFSVIWPPPSALVGRTQAAMTRGLQPVPLLQAGAVWAAP